MGCWLLTSSRTRPGGSMGQTARSRGASAHRDVVLQFGCTEPLLSAKTNPKRLLIWCDGPVGWGGSPGKRALSQHECLFSRSEHPTSAVALTSNKYFVFMAGKPHPGVMSCPIGKQLLVKAQAVAVNKMPFTSLQQFLPAKGNCGLSCPVSES